MRAHEFIYESDGKFKTMFRLHGPLHGPLVSDMTKSLSLFKAAYEKSLDPTDRDRLLSYIQECKTVCMAALTDTNLQDCAKLHPVMKRSLNSYLEFWYRLRDFEI